MAQQTRSRSSGWQRRAFQASFLAQRTAITAVFMTVSTPLSSFPLCDAHYRPAPHAASHAFQIIFKGHTVMRRRHYNFPSLGLCVIVLAPLRPHAGHFSSDRLEASSLNNSAHTRRAELWVRQLPHQAAGRQHPGRCPPLCAKASQAHQGMSLDAV